ncbi:hypothetical protein PO118_03110, partial [Bacteroides thetaiotaomicron]|uniref:hypothetical protein n=1 Tax=Bacteroides thetaiotaomicron TaxID=818 RepID=UPI00232DBE19
NPKRKNYICCDLKEIETRQSLNYTPSQPAPFKELEISPYFIHSYTGFPLITIRVTVYNE